ncbi:MAG: type II toxin-antitoxin system VapB family antitoxin [Pseudomonadota bacterium]
MATQLNIKDPITIRLARDLAASSGKSVTAVIRAALERQEREFEARTERLATEFRELGQEFRTALPAEKQTMTARELQDAIYDEDGVPK